MTILIGSQQGMGWDTIRADATVKWMFATNVETDGRGKSRSGVSGRAQASGCPAWVLPALLLIYACEGTQAARTSEATKAPVAPLSLSASVEKALHDSPQARAARFARDAALAQADRARPFSRPTLTASTSGTLQGPHVLFPRPDGPAAIVLPERVLRLDVVMEQTIYRGGGREARRRYAAQSDIAELDYRKSLIGLATSVVRAYYDVLRAQSGVRTATASLDGARRYQEVVEQQVKAGIARPVDIQTVAGQVAEAQSGLQEAESGLMLARMAFNRQLGRPLTAEVSLEPNSVIPVLPESTEAAQEAARSNRAELIALEKELDVARAGVVLARAQSLPAVNLRGQVTEQTPGAFVHEHYAAATIEMKWPLADGGKSRIDVREAGAQAQRLEALLEEARQAVALEVLDAWRRMKDAQERLRLAEIQIRSARATLLVVEKAYEVGRETVLNVQAARREEQAAHGRAARALYDLQTTAVDFESAQGVVPSALEAIAPLPSKMPNLRKREGHRVPARAARGALSTASDDAATGHPIP